ncbi:MAG: isoprenylcysteine carboxylmethyltransferase family protein [Candidatus Eremiobacteraeota bacterium]|nr:isoprenylcysteine carboxylmethyltransferase family protein [Candidatus Eremiobacteraeota bacterium]
MLFGLVYAVSIPLGYVVAGIANVPPQAAFLAFGHVRTFAALAVLFVVGGYALRVWASSFLAASIVWQQDVQLGDLRVSGPYRFTRNPLYLGNLLQSIGIGLLFPWTATIVIVVLMASYELALVSVEEPFLARHNGASYRAYRNGVARLIPLPWKIAPDGGQRGSLRDGLRSELMCAGFAIVTVVGVAVTLIQRASAR